MRLAIACLIAWSASQAEGLLPLATHQQGTPERAFLTQIHYWKNKNWKGIIALQRPGWHRTYPGGTGADDPDDPMWAMRTNFRKSSPVAMSKFTRRNLSAGIVSLTTMITVVGSGTAPGVIKAGERRKYEYTCKLYPVERGWALDTGHCSMSPLP